MITYLFQIVCSSGLKKGSSRLFYKPSPDFDVVAVVGIGKEDATYNAQEDIDERKQNIRTAAAGEDILYIYIMNVLPNVTKKKLVSHFRRLTI